MKANKWKTLSRKQVFNHPRMQLVEDEVELPDGTKTTYLRQAPRKAFSVAVIAINEEQQILLQKEYSYPINKTLWQLPGGGAHEQERIEAAAKRELMEESGLKADTCRTIGFMYVNNRRSDEKQYVVVCTGLKQQKAEGDPEEFIENYWLSPEEIRRMLAQGTFQNCNLLAALSMYFYTQ